MTSSSNPQKYSATFIGLAGFIPTAIALAKVFGVEGISVDDLMPLLKDADSALVFILSAVSFLFGAYGFLRKIYHRLVQLRYKFFE